MFNWAEFLELAQALQNLSGERFSDEASNRTAVSRAYYAAFCTARNYAEANLGFTRTATPRDHALLRQHLQSLGGAWSIIAELLQELRVVRNMCDYEDTVSDLVQMTNDAIRNAEFILQQCQQATP
jgi:uncharacterized protein (UPF0332 family)